MIINPNWKQELKRVLVLDVIVISIGIIIGLLIRCVIIIN
jgi:hypothetical protein